MSVQLAQYRDLYFSEAHEQLGAIAAALRILERKPGERNALDVAFRAAHTLKGMSATMRYDEISVFAHAFEDLLQSTLGHSNSPGASIYPLFRTLDHLNNILNRLETGESAPAEGLGPEPTAAKSRGSAESIENCALVRVHTRQLDQVMARGVELLARAIRLANPRNAFNSSDDSQLSDMLAGVKQLQSDLWCMQMAPIGEVFARFPPMLHELARSQNKEIRVAVEGGELEVGRRILEEVGEPLLHLLRNAVVHGIEPLTERLTLGKDPRGTVTLRAWPEGESVILEVGDDGRGLDARRILQAAYEQAFISGADRETMSEAQAYDLLMLPGFSMSPLITSASGRGIGLDIVRSKVEILHGTIRTCSHLGTGTCFNIEIPRIIGALQVELVRVGSQVLAIPAAQIESRRSLSGMELDSVTTGQEGAPGRTRQPIDLHTVYDIPQESGSETRGMLLITTHTGLAIRVDEFLGRALWSKDANGSKPAVPLLDTLVLHA